MTKKCVVTKCHSLEFARQDRELEGLLSTQQNRVLAEEHRLQDIAFRSSARKQLVRLKQICHALRVCAYACVFFAGMNAASAVYLFGNARETQLVLSVVCILLGLHVADYFEGWRRRYERELKYREGVLRFNDRQKL